MQCHNANGCQPTIVRPSHRLRRGSPGGQSEIARSTANAEARARCAVTASDFYRGLAIRYERKGTRAIRIDAELLSKRTSLAAERSENSRGDRVCSQSRNRASIRRIRRRTRSGRAVSRRRQDFLDQQRLTARPAWKKQTPTGTAETTGVVIARVSIHSKPMRKRPDTGALPSGFTFRQRPWSAGPPGPCWSSQSGSPEASSPLGSRARDRCAGARSLGSHP